MSFEVAEIQPTPNPNALKFILNRTISDHPTSFLDPASAGDHPLATRLFAIGGVTSLLFLGDFVTVNKAPESDWAAIKRSVRKALAED